MTNTTIGGTWSSSNTLVATVNSSGEVSGVAAGTVTISYTVTANDCSATATKSITVNALPSAPTANNVTACYDGSAHTAGATVAGGETVVWYAEATGATAASAPSRSGVGTTTTYAAARNTTTGCESSTRTTVTVTVNALPSITISNQGAVCAGSSRQLGYTSDITPQSVEWTSSNPGVASVNVTNGLVSGTLTGTASGTATITCKVTTAAGCTSSDTYLITVYPMPTVNPVGDVAVCSGGTVSQISFGTTVTSPAVTYSWTADANCSLVGLASSGTGNIGAFTANANTGTSAISTTITVTPKIGDCTGTTENFTITVYPSLTAGAIGADQTICYNTVPAPFSSLTPAGGGSSTPAYLWQYSTDGIIWTDIDGAASEEYAPATALTVTSQYRRRATNDCGTVDTDPVTVTVRPELPLNYPDIRIRICPYAGKSVNLSKYLDTLSLTSIKWESVSPNVQIDDIVAGTVLMDRLKAPTVYTFNYTVGNPCSADIKRKIYLEVLKPGGMRPLMDTVAVCHEYAEALQINQLFGIEARGSWSYAADGNITSYITESHSTTHDGAVIINGKAIYGDSSISTVNYHGVAAKRVTVTYTTASDSCLAGKPYTITIILTPDIMK